MNFIISRFSTVNIAITEPYKKMMSVSNVQGMIEIRVYDINLIYAFSDKITKRKSYLIVLRLQIILYFSADAL